MIDNILCLNSFGYSITLPTVKSCGESSSEATCFLIQCYTKPCERDPTISLYTIMHSMGQWQSMQVKEGFYTTINAMQGACQIKTLFHARSGCLSSSIPVHAQGASLLKKKSWNPISRASKQQNSVSQVHFAELHLAEGRLCISCVSSRLCKTRSQIPAATDMTTNIGHRAHPSAKDQKLRNLG